MMSLLLLSGCLNIKLEDQYADPDAITTTDTARELLASAYNSLPRYQMELSILGDDFVTTNLTGKYVDILITYLKDQNMLFGILIDVSNQVNYDNEINKVKMETLKTTDEVIKKQMRVAQEIASLLGETTAETKVALLKLKKTLSDEHIEKGNK